MSWLTRLAAPFGRSQKHMSEGFAALQTHMSASWSPRHYRAFAEEGYRQNPIAFRCVRLISETASSVPLRLMDNGKELTDHPLQKILIHANPNESGVECLERIYAFLLLNGNAYIQAAFSGSTLHEIYVLRPDRVKIIVGPDGWPEAYEYSVGGKTVRFAVHETTGMKQILHIRSFHPLNDHYGLSPVEPAGGAIDIHNAAQEWNKALLDNAARPSGALIYGSDNGAHIPPDQFDRLKDQLKNAYQGAVNAGRPLLLEGGLDWKPMSFTPVELDFLNAKHAAAREIALAFGVPPQLLGIPGDNTYANYKEANIALWRETVLPLVRKVTAALSAWISPLYKSISIEYCTDDIPALAVEREAFWKSLQHNDFMTVREKRERAGLPPVPLAEISE